MPRCPQCQRQFKNDQGLKIHIGKQHRAKPKPKGGPGRKKGARGGLSCEICGRWFKLPLHLGRHRSVAHGKARRPKGTRRASRAPAAPAGVDVSGLSIDLLFALKAAVDSRLADIAVKIRKAKVGA
jgi:uncharacterized C2H2 Zn-finger protein